MFVIREDAMLVIQVKMIKQHGLECYQILINGTLMNQYFSKEMAEHKKKQYLRAWNIDKVQLTRGAK